MKKLLFLLLLPLIGCRCLISQVPPQYIYAGQSCEAPLPDYRLKVTISDNCQIENVTQTPSPGFLLMATNMITNVTIRAVDNSGNASQITFSVTLLDTIPPVIGWEGLTSLTEQEMIDLYRQWEAGVKVHSIAKWIYDQSWTQGFAFADTTYIMESLKTFTHSITLSDEEYDEWLTYMSSNIN